MRGGEFVSFLFGDDYYLVKKTERQLARFAELPADYAVVYGPGFRLNESTGQRWPYRGRGPSGWVARDLITHFHSASLTPIAPLYRREPLARTRFHEEIFLEGTESLLLRLSLTCRFSYLDEPLVVMRDHPGNHGKAYRANTEFNFFLLDRLREERGYTADLDPVIVGIKAVALRSLGWATLRLTDDARAARGYLIGAVRIQRRQVLHPRTVLGLALSALPARARRALNAIGSRLRRHRSGLEYREDYS